MNNCNIVGKVLKAKMDTTKSGKPIGKVRVEVGRKYQDKVFTKRFDVCVYGQDSTFAGALHPGTLVWASGEVDAYVSEYNGKTYANLQITGRIGIVENGEPAPRQNTPAKAPSQAELPTTTTAAIDEFKADDDVPF